MTVPWFPPLHGDSAGEGLDREAQTLELGGGRSLTLGEPLGRGSFATVYRSILREASGLERKVAVKLFSSVSSEECHEVFAILQRIASRLACIEHPNVAQVFDCGMWRGRPYVIGELVQGVGLPALLEIYARKRRRLPLDLALFIAAEIGEALAGARLARDHDGLQLGMLHHGLSAREVVLSWRGEVKVTDFESSTIRVGNSSVRSLRGLACRVSSMAPEVAQGAVSDARSDVFSFGVLLRELFIGPRFPASVANTEAIRLAREGYVQPMTFQPHLPAGLIAVMERALEVDPDFRYPNACPLAFDLRREALAMGVGDGRYFLKKALERECLGSAEEITTQKLFSPFGSDEPTPTLREPRPATSDIRELQAERGEVVPLNRRR